MEQATTYLPPTGGLLTQLKKSSRNGNWFGDRNKEGRRMHVFTSAMTYGKDFLEVDDFGHSGWVRFAFQTHELHEVFPFEWNDFDGQIKYIDTDDQLAVFEVEG